MRASAVAVLLVALACGGGMAEPDASVPPGPDAAAPCVPKCVGTDCGMDNGCGAACTVEPRTGCTYTGCQRWDYCINDADGYCRQQAFLCCSDYREKYPGAPCRM